ncbi:MAG: hypothetical protein HC932_00190 [Thermales bacterium]|nr:hypothetical protein [Thermales bacterium]
MIGVFQIEPVDVKLLSEDNQNLFTQNLKTFVASLHNTKAQLITRNRLLSASDMSDYLIVITPKKLII